MQIGAPDGIRAKRSLTTVRLANSRRELGRDYGRPGDWGCGLHTSSARVCWAVLWIYKASSVKHLWIVGSIAWLPEQSGNRKNGTAETGRTSQWKAAV